MVAVKNPLVVNRASLISDFFFTILYARMHTVTAAKAASSHGSSFTNITFHALSTAYFVSAWKSMVFLRPT